MLFRTHGAHDINEHVGNNLRKDQITSKKDLFRMIILDRINLVADCKLTISLLINDSRQLLQR